jgi:hypothetical protein
LWKILGQENRTSQRPDGMHFSARMIFSAQFNLFGGWSSPNLE